MTKPLVSVITPTWQRIDYLFDRCIPSVQAQDHPRLEHVIVHDGPPETGAGAIAARIAAEDDLYTVPVLLDYIEEHKIGGRTRSRLRAIGNSRGDYIAYLDDDDAYRPHHISTLAAALDAHPEAGFAYSQMASRDGAGTVVAVIGQSVPAHCQIGTPMVVHRRELLEYGTWGPDHPAEDWQLIERWLNAGIEYVYVPHVTVDVWPSLYRGG